LEVGTGRRGATQEVEVEEYIKSFKWDPVRFQVEKSLLHLGAKVSSI